VWRQSSPWIGCSHSVQRIVFTLSGGVRCCASVPTLVAVRSRETSRVTKTSHIVGGIRS
jgi:hypothetical protein